MSQNTTPQVILDAIQQAIKDDCEKIIEKAVKDCDRQIRKSVNDTAISIARMVRYDMHTDELHIVVKFGSQK